MSGSTPYVDSLDNPEAQFLLDELSRLRVSEAEHERAFQASQSAFQQETRTLINLIKDRLGEHDQSEKVLNVFQNKLKQGQTVVLDLERTLTKLQKEAEQARK